MDFQVWLAFVSATFVLSIIPGPSVLVVTAQAISNGWRLALLSIVGEILGGVCLMIVSLMGVGALVAASPAAFQALKWFGVGFLIYLGLKALLAAAFPPKGVAAQLGGSFRAGFYTALLNPKSLVFYLAFLPQFVDVAQPSAMQYTVLIFTAASVAGLVLTGYALAATHLTPDISMPRAQRKVSGLSGVLYLAGGAYVAAAR